MGRELQKRKNRSSVRKVTQKPKSKKNLLQHPVIAANWDKHATLSQNYKRLGLTAKLNKSTGGVEKTVLDSTRNGEDDGDKRAKGDSLRISGSKLRQEKIEMGEVRIERDPKTGAILRVLEDGAKTRPNPLGDMLNELDSESENEDEEQGSTVVNTAAAAPGGGASTEVIRQLEARASVPESKYKRKQSENEIAFIETLVRKHGEDVGRMARDTKTNYMQRSEGDLKKRIKIWRENGGSVS